MASAERGKMSLRTRITIALVVISLLGPIGVYVATFGLTISGSHIRWAEMGSAMSGIYSPLIALLALMVVLGQLKAQNQINRHQIDQAHIEQNRVDVQYYLEQLDRALQVRDPNGSTVRQMLHQHFQPRNRAALAEAKLQVVAQSLNRQYPQPFALWSAIYPIMSGLRAPGRFPYEHQAVGTIQKMVAMSTFETCATLDNFHFCLTEGRTGIKYEFSPLLDRAQS